ncbi:MAG: polysaccharide deacetylase family protein [Akkermansiaceae bacterium]
MLQVAGQTNANTPSTPETPATVIPGKPPVSDGVRVSVLGYHDFSKTKKATQMLLPTATFRKQMQAIRDLGLNVITMEDFMAWKRGEKKIKDKSVVITIDDGWKSVYTDAYPILKEFKYPFTVYLYKNYVDGGGSALTTPMIREMMNNGCTIGSHSVSHPYPSEVKAERAKGTDSFASYLRKEMGDSKKFLESKFKTQVKTYAYPGGYVTGEMLPVATEVGYDFLFTVLPGKTTQTTSNFTVPRYIILGTHDNIFRNATSFEATSTSVATDGAIVQSTPHPVEPEPGALVSERLPRLSADLSKVANIDVESIVMRVAGFGKVPATYNASTGVLSWQITRRLRARTCSVTVQWRTKGSTQFEKPMTWVFRINREAAYQPQEISTEKP